MRLKSSAKSKLQRLLKLLVLYVLPSRLKRKKKLRLRLLNKPLKTLTVLPVSKLQRSPISQ